VNPPALRATAVAGAAVLLAGAPVAAVVAGASWFVHAAVAVALVTAVGVALARFGAAPVAVGQLLAALLLLTLWFTEHGVLGVLPGPGALREMAALLAGAGQQIQTSVAPVAPTPEILFLVTAAFALLAVATHLAAVAEGAPATAGIPLLAAFAVPAALADTLLPWWTMAAAAAGFGLLLLVGDRPLRGLPGAAALTAAALAVALAIGSTVGWVGTAGRFGGGLGGGPGGSIGLNPFTALRGQLDEATPAELFRVRGLPQPAYLRVLTLRDYVPDSGWQASPPDLGIPLTGQLPAPTTSGVPASVSIENRGFRDYWLPLYGVPLAVSDLAGDWFYDRGSGTAYAPSRRNEDGWTQQVLLPTPSVAQLRSGTGGDVSRRYLDTVGVDPRVAEIAANVTADATTPFDRAVAINDYFSGPGSPFRYSLETAPGSGDDALVEFLTVGRAGYCEQFASAMAVMLRTVGVPSRVAVGFTAGTDAGAYRSVSTADAHAWVEAWFPGVGWTTFDPTPLTDGRALVPPYVVEARAEAAGGGEEPVPEPAGSAAEPLPELTPDEAVGEDPATAPDEAGPVADEGFPVWPFVVVGLVCVAAGAPAVRRLVQRRRRLDVVSGGGPGAAGAGWAELLAESADRGVPIEPSDTVRGAARRMVRDHRLDADTQQALRRLVGAVEASFYGGAEIGDERLAEDVRLVRTGIATASCPVRSSTGRGGGRTTRTRLVRSQLGGAGWIPPDHSCSNRRRNRSSMRPVKRFLSGSASLAGACPDEPTDVMASTAPPSITRKPTTLTTGKLPSHSIGSATPSTSITSPNANSATPWSRRRRVGLRNLPPRTVDANLGSSA
jgi:transglutaminase-like putative cysteine protease